MIKPKEFSWPMKMNAQGEEMKRIYLDVIETLNGIILDVSRYSDVEKFEEEQKLIEKAKFDISKLESQIEERLRCKENAE